LTIRNGSVVGGDMSAGIALTVAAPAVATIAVSYGTYKIQNLAAYDHGMTIDIVIFTPITRTTKIIFVLTGYITFRSI
jgi:hypothetical protein